MSLSNADVRKRSVKKDTSTTSEGGETEKKAVHSGAKKGWSCGSVTLVVIGGLSTFLLIIHFLPSYINPEYVRLPSPPKLDGALAKNELLTKVDKLFEDALIGAESIARDPKTGTLYTGTSDGRVVKIDGNDVSTVAKLGVPPCDPRLNDINVSYEIDADASNTLEDEDNCGRPLGMRFDSQGRLVVADAYLGIYRIDVKSGASELICRNDSVIDGPRAMFLNDVALSEDGLIYVTDSSTKWQRRQVPVAFLENRAEGRLLVCDPQTGKMRTLKAGIHFANGLQLSDDKKSILIVETGLARILRYHLSGEKAGQTEIFADNLPGFGDNIRPSSGGGYWLGIAFVRSAEHFSPMDTFGPLPALRCLLGEITPPMFMMEMLPEHGLVVELDQSGKIIRSLHDTSGEIVSSVSEVLDVKGVLYLGSYHAQGLARLKLE